MRKAKTTTVAELLRARPAGLTTADRKLSQALQAGYPMVGLTSITEFAKAAGVSTPSVLRFAKKLGFAGYPTLQRALRAEVAAQLQNPVVRHQRWSEQAPQTHILNRFADAAMENLRSSLRLLDHKVFDGVARLLADRKRQVHVLGGRITGHLASYLHTHLHMARGGVNLVATAPAFWPQQLLDINSGDVLVVFDVRRYDARVLDFAASAKQRGAKIVLITDQWMSPVARLADHSLAVRVEVPTSWDSNMVTLFTAEALVAAVVNSNWPATEARIRDIDVYFENGRRIR